MRADRDFADKLAGSLMSDPDRARPFDPAAALPSGDTPFLDDVHIAHPNDGI